MPGRGSRGFVKEAADILVSTRMTPGDCVAAFAALPGLDRTRFVIWAGATLGHETVWGNRRRGGGVAELEVHAHDH